ncbi:uncharacterized protein EI90DRAFT_3030065 [Cantharellus anzutake]|uniref:uncharacterized protein n=1 Tax=Cantharellus anzutake TaxID=1750568 RepID=UPI0019061BCF|nr:uncharacterized protein EI90DRAFT_3030065 [Cantharellus anzutake]KAF8342743.1 hypothetical protein EI90DRAFT_3030065 [Cantharellus anzutake]
MDGTVVDEVDNADNEMEEREKELLSRLRSDGAFMENASLSGGGSSEGSMPSSSSKRKSSMESGCGNEGEGMSAGVEEVELEATMVSGSLEESPALVCADSDEVETISMASTAFSPVFLVPGKFRKPGVVAAGVAGVGVGFGRPMSLDGG